MARSRTGDLSEYRSALNRKGEVAIGARARAERRKRILMGAAGLGLIATAVAMHFVLQAPEHGSRARKTAVVLVQCMDPNCGYQGLVEVPLENARFPVKCPRCKQQTCQKVWECRDCGHRFVPLGPTGELICRECGSRRVGTATTVGGEVARE
jgi:predicted Zn-ribbon and HTH transcriptional regulator